MPTRAPSGCPVERLQQVEALDQRDEPADQDRVRDCPDPDPRPEPPGDRHDDDCRPPRSRARTTAECASRCPGAGRPTGRGRASPRGSRGSRSRTGTGPRPATTRAQRALRAGRGQTSQPQATHSLCGEGATRTSRARPSGSHQFQRPKTAIRLGTRIERIERGVDQDRDREAEPELLQADDRCRRRARRTPRS